MKNSAKVRHLGLHQSRRGSEATSLAKIPGAVDRSQIPFKFVELIGRTNFSFLQGASHPDEMVEQAALLEYKGIAICDLNGLYGVARGFKTARSPSLFSSSVNVDESFKYLIGTELHLVEKLAVVLMPLNMVGYSQLCELLTIGKRDVSKGFSKLSANDVMLKTENLLCFLLPPYTEKQFLDFQEAFQDRLYLPIWRDFTWESRQFSHFAFSLEEKFRAQLFATNRPLMHIKERYPLFDTLSCIYNHQKLDEAEDILLQNSERYLKPLEDLAIIWRDRRDLLEKTYTIAKRVEFSLEEIRYRYPNSNLPVGSTPSDYLRYLVEQGLQKRALQDDPDILKIVEHELKIIKDLQYEDYFLTLYEICQFAKSKGILYQGRGSAANSVICYAIELTAVNPKGMGFMFERFISRERKEPPDIDIDFEHSRREEVIQHIYEKYNEKHAAMVCTVIRYRTRMAFREVAKVLGIPLETVNKIIRFMGRDGMHRLVDTENIHKQFKVEKSIWDLALKLTRDLQGFPRHLGIHTGGFIITQDPLNEMVPVEKASMNGRYVIQWNKDDVQYLKLMKIDVLSLGMLTALQKCFDLLKLKKEIDLDLYSFNYDDPQVYDMCCKADTVGVFQIESRAQMQTLPRLKPREFYDLVVQIAIVRPGPLQGGMVHPYLRRRQGLEKTDYGHKDLIPILEKTHGVPIFQEQVMRIVVAVAGFSPGEADELRRVMSDSWRKRGTMNGIRGRILQGMAQHGLSEDYAERIYKTIEGFANYGFPESHAASFALLTYASSYIKCHYPDVFVCGLLNSQPMGFYSPRSLIADAKRHGVEFLKLDIQKSDYDYSIEKQDGKDFVRLGLRSISGIPTKILHAIVEERKLKGPFLSLTDFIQRLQIPKSAILKIAASGAFECFHADARKLLWKIESLSLDSRSFLWGQEKESFSLADRENDSFHIPFESDWKVMEREYQSKGYSLDHHPMKILRSSILEMNQKLIGNQWIPFSQSQEILEIKKDRKVRVAGMISVTQRPPTAKGMCFITLEDEFGMMNIIIPPDIYQRDRLIIYSSSFLEICGILEKRGELRNIKAQMVRALFSNQADKAVKARSLAISLKDS